jgi:ABC-type Fe3+-hydroxamate transport system substrate-binding protein
VSLVPSITETLCEFGLARNIVGITDYCVSPARALRGKARVGGPMNPSVKKILSLRPDIVFASDEENRKRDAAALTRHGAPVYVARVRGVAEAIGMLRDLSCIWPHLKKPRKIIRETESLLIKRLKSEGVRRQRGAKRREGSDPRAPRVGRSRPRLRSRDTALRVAYLIWKNPYMTCGGDTYISRLMMACGGVNVFHRRGKRYFALTLDGLARAKPELVLLSTEPYKFLKKDCAAIRKELRNRGLVNCRVKIADGEMLAWYGARTRDALKKLPALFRRV